MTTTAAGAAGIAPAGHQAPTTEADRFRLALAHREPDRVPVHDSPWPTTVARWRREGLPAGVSPADYFGFGLTHVAGELDPRFPVEELNEGGDYRVWRTEYGQVRKQKRDLTSTPEIEEWPIRTREDWERVKPRLEPTADRLDLPALRRTYDAARRAGRFVTFNAHIGYAQFLEYMRNDELLMLLVTDPGWVHDMFATHARLVTGLAQRMWDAGIHYDGAFLACDLGYRNASLFSPATYRALQFPHDRDVFDFFHGKGLPVILHSDGCVKALIPHFLDAGLDCLQPLEVKAGMDLLELKREYGGRLAFMGGIDARAMADPDPAAIEREVRTKLDVARRGGGYIYHSDHSVPHDVSFDQYRHVIDLVRRYGRCA
ncbi:MAG TPA: uroporphyrinogen decarboxylase family protein [Chloroflexota bacterium]|nr:uroporphyrinogen decarboxylase family protein [Chloroflexota bacterium]